MHLNKEFTSKEESQWNTIQEKIFQERQKRVQPGLDDKILTDWNALMIAAYAEAARLLNDKHYLNLAIDGAKFIEKTLIKDEKLFHRYRNEDVGIAATAFDYSYLVFAYVQLYKATLDEHYLLTAEKLNQTAMNLFWDSSSAGFFNSNNDDIILQQKDSYDGALPSVNAVLYFNLLSLSQLLHDTKLYEQALELNKYFAGKINHYPMAYTFWLTAQGIQQQVYLSVL